LGIFLKLYISINSNGASVDRTAETREPSCIDKAALYSSHRQQMWIRGPGALQNSPKLTPWYAPMQ